MCGIVGVFSSRITASHVAAFRNMLVADQVRGFESTGVIKMDEGERVSWMKKPTNACDFLDMKSAAKFIDGGIGGLALIGHNRWSTRGGVSYENAHPFSHGRYVMVHNGTLRSQWDLEDAGHKFTVDSEAICWSLHSRGIERTIELLNGTFALVWVDTKEGVMQMVRNDDRPMYLATVKNSQTVFFGSEELMVRWAMARNNIEVDHVEPLPVGRLLTFSHTQGAVTVKGRELSLRPKPVASPHHGTNYGNTKTTTSTPISRGKMPAPPTSQAIRNDKREKRSNDLLKKHRLEVGDLIHFWPEDFAPYSVHGGLGKVEAATEIDGVVVHIHGEKRDDWEYGDTVYEARIAIASEGPGNDVTVSVDGNIRAMTWEEWFQESYEIEDAEDDDIEPLYPLHGVLVTKEEYIKAVQQTGGTCAVCASPIQADKVDDHEWLFDTAVAHIDCAKIWKEQQ